MNKNLYLAGAVSLAFHGTLALIGLFQPRPVAPAPVTDDGGKIFVIPAIPPEPVDIDDTDPDQHEESTDPAVSPPSLPDVPSPRVSPFEQVPQPTLPPTSPDITRIPPNIGIPRTSTPIIPWGELGRHPVPVVQGPPNYPYDLKTRGVTGQVLVSFIVDARGYVHDAYAVQSEYPEFSSAAVAAVSKWKFQPGMKDGKAVATRMQVPIIFNLDSNS